MKLIYSLIPITLLALLVGCATKPASLEGNYSLTELTGYEAPANAKVTMTITPDRIGGKGPINNWNGPINDGKVGMMISTKMAGPPELMDMEMAFYKAIDSAELTLDGNTLSFVKDGATVAVFERTE